MENIGCINEVQRFDAHCFVVDIIIFTGKS